MTEQRRDLEALNTFVVACPQLAKLESLLGGFNIFQVLKFEHGEIRHSNVLSWLLDPAESHGLDHLFLQRWLMRVVFEAPRLVDVSAVDIDCWQPLRVEIRREWNHIDLLVLVTLQTGERWVVCIENKVNSRQHSDQLRNYRRVVQRCFQGWKTLFILLSKDEEAPEDEAYLTGSYTQVHRILREVVSIRSGSIGNEPLVLITNYLRLLEEKFMNESDIARTAQKIYQQHKRALDIIFEHRPDFIQDLSDRLFALLKEREKDLDIIMVPSARTWVRFIPVSWEQPGNTHGTAVKGVNRGVVIEISLKPDGVMLSINAWKTPEAWIDRMWARSGMPPFQRPRTPPNRPKHNWCRLHSESSGLTLPEDEVMDADEMTDQIFQRIHERLRSPELKDAIRIIAEELPALEKAFSADSGQIRQMPHAVEFTDVHTG